jgi:hypothetical protein
MNYQYRYGTGTIEATRFLYHDGGFARYYAGMGAALFQGPIARLVPVPIALIDFTHLRPSFGDTAANAGILALLGQPPMPIFMTLRADVQQSRTASCASCRSCSRPCSPRSRPRSSG